MPTPKQMEKMAVALDRPPRPARGLAPNDNLPPEYWQALLEASYAEPISPIPEASGRVLRLNQVPQHILRVGCRRCGRIVEIQKVDAARLYGADAIWKDVGHRLLDNTCTQRNGRHEEDGCWPTFDIS